MAVYNPDEDCKNNNIDYINILIHLRPQNDFVYTAQDIFNSKLVPNL